MSATLKTTKRALKTELILVLLTACFIAALGASSVYRCRAERTRDYSVSVSAADAAEDSGRSAAPLVNINTADAGELAELPGIGGVTAGRIVEYREKNGPFEKAEDIMNVDGIGEGKFAGMEDMITVGEK